MEDIEKALDQIFQTSNHWAMKSIKERKHKRFLTQAEFEKNWDKFIQSSAYLQAKKQIKKLSK